MCIITWLYTWNSCSIGSQLYSTIYKGKMVNYWGHRKQKLHHYVFWPNYRAWNSSLDETPPFICFLKSLLLESIPNGKSPSIGHPGDISTGNLPSQTCAVLRSTWNCRWISYQHPVPCTAYCLRLTPVSSPTLESTKPLVLFSSPTEWVTETWHILVPMGSRSTTCRRLSWFLINMILLSSQSHSLSHLISTGD